MSEIPAYKGGRAYETSSGRAVPCLALFLLGAGLECAQALKDYRTFEYADIAANSLGIAPGLLAALPRIVPVLARLEAYMRSRRST